MSVIQIFANAVRLSREYINSPRPRLVATLLVWTVCIFMNGHYGMGPSFWYFITVSATVGYELAASVRAVLDDQGSIRQRARRDFLYRIKREYPDIYEVAYGNPNPVNLNAIALADEIDRFNAFLAKEYPDFPPITLGK